MTVCTKCGQRERRSLKQRYCCECHAASMKAWRAKHVTVPRGEVPQGTFRDAVLFLNAMQRQSESRKA